MRHAAGAALRLNLSARARRARSLTRRSALPPPPHCAPSATTTCQYMHARARPPPRDGRAPSSRGAAAASKSGGVADALDAASLCAGGAASAVDALLRRFAAGDRYHTLRDVLRVALPEAAPSPAEFTIEALELVAARTAALSAPRAADSAAEAAAAPASAAVLTPLFHLLLEALACVEPWARGDAAGAAGTAAAAAVDASRCGASAARAARLLAAAVATPPRGAGAGLDARAALRVAQTFRLRWGDLSEGAAADAGRYANALFARGQHTPAVLLALQLRAAAAPPPDDVAAEAATDLLPAHYPTAAAADSVPYDVASPAAFPALLAARQEGLAEALAAALGGGAPAALVVAALSAKRYRAAHDAARRFRLEARFPQAAALHTAATLRRLAERGLWDAAAALAGADGDHRRALVTSAAEAGEPGVALDLVHRFGLEAEFDEAALAAAAAAAAARDADAYLALGVPPERVHWVADVADLPRLAQALAAAPAIGLDAEWRAIAPPPSAVPLPRQQLLSPPRRGRGALEEAEALAESADVEADVDDVAAGRVALLQLATADDVFLLDLPALAARCPAALSDALAPALSDANVPILGYGVAADVAKAAGGAPGVAALRGATCLLDLRDAWRAARGEAPPAGGLSGAANAALGRPLDKRPRLSDWERRPLTAAQRRYAANDAHVALRIYAHLVAGLPEQRRHALVATHARACSPPPRPRAPRRRDDDRDGDGNGGGGGGNGTAAVAATAAAADAAPAALGPPAVAAALAAAGERDAAVAGAWRLVRTHEAGASSTAAAAALGVPLRRIVKSLGIVVDATPPSLLLLLLRGDQRADLAAVAAAARTHRRALRLATAAECVQLFGYAPGCMPPLGHRSDVRTLMDASLFRGDSDAADVADDVAADEELYYAGGGAADWHAAMPLRALRAASRAECAPIAAGTSPGSSAAVAAAAAAAAAAASGAVAFVVDGALARLGRWLRCLGCDVVYVPTQRGGAHAAQLAALIAPPATSAAPRRVLLTRDTRLLCRRELAGGAAFHVASDDPRQQLAAVRSHFGLAFDPARLLSRCAACNGVVAVRRAAADIAADASLPGYVRADPEHTEVWACDTCAKSYWVGPKSRRAVELMASLRASAIWGHPLPNAAAGESANAAAADDAASPSPQLAAQIRDVMAAAAAAATAAADASGDFSPSLAC